MKLYHGTSEKNLSSILANGLFPRNLSDSSNWEHTIESRDDCVYLTTCYAAYFASAAAKEHERYVLVEVDTELLDASLFLPDEDGIEQMTRGQDFFDHLDMIERTKYFRDHLVDFRQYWKDVLSGLGTCAYQGSIPTSSIIAISIFDPKKNPSMAMSASDPTITTLNHALCGGKYRAITSWMFGNPISVDDFLGFEGFPEEVKMSSAKVLENTDALEILPMTTSTAKRKIR